MDLLVQLGLMSAAIGEGRKGRRPHHAMARQVLHSGMMIALRLSSAIKLTNHGEFERADNLISLAYDDVEKLILQTSTISGALKQSRQASAVAVAAVMSPILAGGSRHEPGERGSPGDGVGENTDGSD